MSDANECFVPNCKNLVGVPFPRDLEVKQKWLESLELADLVPKVGSFVCYLHFNPCDLIKEDGSGTRLSNRLKRGAVPCITNPAIVEEEKTCDMELTEVDVEPLESSVNIENKLLSDEAQEETNDATGVTEGEVRGDKEEEEEHVLDDKICRACMSGDNLVSTIFNFIEDDITISSALMMCAFPINVSENDNLPKDVCQPCLETLKIAYKFQKQCIHTDDILQLRYADLGRKRRASTEGALNKSSKKKRNSPITEPSELISHSLQNLMESGPIQSRSAQINNTETVSPRRKSRRLAIIGQNISLKLQKSRSKIDIDEIEKNLEEIHRQNLGCDVITEEDHPDCVDDEKTATVEDILNTLEDGNSAEDNSNDEDVMEEFLEKKIEAPVPGQKIIVKTHFPMNKKKEIPIPSGIKLPKDVKIRPVERYQSPIGKFRSCIKSGVYDSVFVEAGDYLFELGLMKGNCRHLRCTVPTCSSHAKQKASENGDIESVVEVLTPHNHRVPNSFTKKKQMFLCVMRKKMQTDRTLNIRIIYEDACMEDPEIKQLVPLRNVINEICRHQLTHKMQPINSFDDFFAVIDSDPFEKLHFTHNSQQFYREKFSVDEDGSKAVLFANSDVIQQVSESKVMYVDASFKIDTNEDFKYQLVTVLVWIEDSYYPIIFVLVSKKSQLIFRKVFEYVRDELAPDIRPQEIVTDYEANLYYALAETYTDSNIGGSVFYYTQNLYKKICSLNLSRDLETNSYFRNIYHMLLMLPLLPVNTINDGLNNISLEATNLNIHDVALPLFDHVRNQWILSVTPELFCVHKLENRINENVIAPFKKLRDFLLLTKGKLSRTNITIIHIIEKIIELEAFLRGTYSNPDKKSFGRDLSSFQKKNVLRAWQFIEDHPKIEINNFFSKVLGYIKCMENQLWIWGFYRYDGDTDDILINASHFSIVNSNDDIPDDVEEVVEEEEGEFVEYLETPENTIVMDAVVDQDGVLQTEVEILASTTSQRQEFNTAYVKYVYQ